MLQSGTMSSKSTIASMITTVAAMTVVCTFAVPSAHADINGTESTATAVTSSRSFPSFSTAARQNLTTEHTSTDVEDEAEWGDIDALDVPKTKSQAQQEAERAKAKAEEEARAKAEAEAAAALEAQSQAASRSNQRTTMSGDDTTSSSTSSSSSSSAGTTGTAAGSSSATVSGSAGAAIAKAYSLLGQSMDCTALVSAALAAGGINFHGYPEQYAALGTQVSSLAEAKPGDLLIYRYTGGWNGGAHWDHIALYVGDGQAIHGGWNGSTVALAGTLNPDLIIRVF